MSSKIEPCPFCGCESTLLTGHENYRIAGKHAKACPFIDVDLVVDSREAWNTRAAPIVERQPGFHTCQKCWGAGHLPTRMAGESETDYRARCKAAPPELAELQATIARLTAENERLARIEHQSREALQVANQNTKQVIAERDALAERLKGGQGESGVAGPRERFQKWVLATKHPVFGFLDGHWLARGDDREGYANEYVQGLWVAFKEFSSPPAPVSVVLPIDIKQRLNDVWLFLDGQAELNGCVWGEKPEGRHQFWWRKELRAVVEDLNACLDKVKELNQ